MTKNEGLFVFGVYGDPHLYGPPPPFPCVVCGKVMTANGRACDPCLDKVRVNRFQQDLIAHADAAKHALDMLYFEIPWRDRLRLSLDEVAIRFAAVVGEAKELGAIAASAADERYRKAVAERESLDAERSAVAP